MIFDKGHISILKYYHIGSLVEQKLFLNSQTVNKKYRNKRPEYKEIGLDSGIVYDYFFLTYSLFFKKDPAHQ